MAIVLEDGTGKSDAETYLDETAFDAYIAARNLTTTATIAVKEAALREATEYLDGTFGARWAGDRITRTQALDWPRQFGYDRNGFAIPSTEVPREVASATAELAWKALTATLAPDQTNLGGAKTVSRKKVGPIETTTQSSAGGVSRKVYAKVAGILAPVLDPDTVELVRA